MLEMLLGGAGKLATALLAAFAFAADGDITKPNEGFLPPDPLVMIYEGASGSISSQPSKVTFTGKQEDMLNAYSGGTFNCGGGGFFSASVNLAVTATFALNNTLSIEYRVNGVKKKSASVNAPALISKASLPLTALLKCPAGGTIEVWAASSGLGAAFTTDATENTFTLMKLFVSKSSTTP